MKKTLVSNQISGRFEVINNDRLIPINTLENLSNVAIINPEVGNIAIKMRFWGRHVEKYCVFVYVDGQNIMNPQGKCPSEPSINSFLSHSKGMVLPSYGDWVADSWLELDDTGKGVSRNITITQNDLRKMSTHTGITDKDFITIVVFPEGSPVSVGEAIEKGGVTTRGGGFGYGNEVKPASFGTTQFYSSWPASIFMFKTNMPEEPKKTKIEATADFKSSFLANLPS